MSVYRAEHAYRRNRGKTYYRNVLHPGSPHHIPPFYCQIPIDFLPWDNDQGILAFPRKTTPWGRCRCGYVERVYYFKLGHRSSSAKKTSANVLQLGLKIMNKDQVGTILEEVVCLFLVYSSYCSIDYLIFLTISHFFDYLIF